MGYAIGKIGLLTIIAVFTDKSCPSAEKAGRLCDFAAEFMIPREIVRNFYEYHSFAVIRSRSEIICLSGFKIQILHREVAFVILPVKAGSIREQVHVFVINTAVRVILRIGEEAIFTRLFGNESEERSFPVFVEGQSLCLVQLNVLKNNSAVSA